MQENKSFKGFSEESSLFILAVALPRPLVPPSPQKMCNKSCAMLTWILLDVLDIFFQQAVC